MISNEEEGAPGVEERVRSAVADGGDIAAEVERITRDALASGRLDLQRVRAVAEAVGRGASAGAEGLPGHGREALSSALDGLQRTLIRGAGDARLAVEEAASHVGAYTEGELKRRVEEIRTLESMMLDSLSATAKASSAAGAAVLDDLVTHARRSGTHLGNEVETSMRALSQSLPEALRESALAGLGAARESGARAAEVASGLLSGVAEALREKPAPRDPGTAAPGPGTPDAGEPGGGTGGGGTP